MNESPTTEGKISLEYLEGIALIRYSMSTVAELIHSQHTNRGEGRIYTHDSQLLLNKAKNCCTDTSLNDDITGPGVFLLKQLTKQYGVTFLTSLMSTSQSMEWVIPYNLKSSDEVRKVYYMYITVHHGINMLGST